MRKSTRRCLESFLEMRVTFVALVVGERVASNTENVLGREAVDVDRRTPVRWTCFGMGGVAGGSVRNASRSHETMSRTRTRSSGRFPFSWLVPVAVLPACLGDSPDIGAADSPEAAELDEESEKGDRAGGEASLTTEAPVLPACANSQTTAPPQGCEAWCASQDPSCANACSGGPCPTGGSGGVTCANAVDTNGSCEAWCSAQDPACVNVCNALPCEGVVFDPSCQDASCCPAGLVALVGDANPNSLLGTSKHECLVGLASGDALYGNGGADWLLGGDGNDSLHGGTGPDRIAGGNGNDAIYGGDHDDRIYGNAGDDVIAGDGGNDFIVPGPGADSVAGGAGDDMVVVYDVCELESGEVLSGDGGNDTLVIPVSLAQVQAMGVVVSGFETITEQPSDSCSSECGVAPFCSGRGECVRPGTPVAPAGDPIETGTPIARGCQCEPGFAGATCEGVDPEVVLPEFVGLADPSAWTAASGGARFRRATGLELEANTWIPGTFVVEDASLTTALAAGANSITVTVPTDDTSAATVALDLVGETVFGPFVELFGTPEDFSATVSNSTVLEYVEPAGSPTVLRITALKEDAELRALGLTAGVREIRMFRPGSSVVFDETPDDGGTPPDPGAFVLLVAQQGDNTLVDDLCLPPCAPPADNQCIGDDDEDHDGLVDADDSYCNHSTLCDPSNGHPDHVHVKESGNRYGVIGEIVWCTDQVTRGGGWKSELTARVLQFGGDLRSANDANVSAYNQLLPRGIMRFGFGMCWLASDQNAAIACRNDGVGCPGNYSFPGFGRNGRMYLEGPAKDSIRTVAVDAGLNQPVQNVILLVGSSAVEFDGDEAEGGSPSSGPFESYAAMGGKQTTGNNVRQTFMHELGHTMGLSHSDASMTIDGQFRTIMSATGGNGRAIVFSAASAAIIADVANDANEPLPFHFGNH